MQLYYRAFYGSVVRSPPIKQKKKGFYETSSREQSVIGGPRVLLAENERSKVKSLQETLKSKGNGIWSHANHESETIRSVLPSENITIKELLEKHMSPSTRG